MRLNSEGLRFLYVHTHATKSTLQRGKPTYSKKKYFPQGQLVDHKPQKDYPASQACSGKV